MMRRATLAIVIAASLVQCLEPLPAAESGDASAGADARADAGADTDASTGGSGGAAGTISTDSAVDTSLDVGADAVVDSGDLCADATPTDYEILRLPAGTALVQSAFCSDGFWATVPVVPLITQANAATPSDNTATCKMVWSADSTPNVIWGCCLIKDKDVRGMVTGADGEAWKDDGLEVLLKGNEQPAFDTTTQKTILSVAGGFRDSKWAAGIFDTSYDAKLSFFHALQTNSTLNDAIADSGYAIKWRANLAFDVIPGQRARCDFTLNDWDGNATLATKLVAFGADHTTDMSTAGICRFSCIAP